MAVSPADFYAYSRATGVQIPDDPYEKAKLVPEIKEFRQNQLRAPQQEQSKGPDPLSVGLGVGLALAGGIAGGLGIRKLLRGPAKSATAGVRQVDLGDMTGDLATASRFRPRAANESIPTPSKVAQQIGEEEFVAYRPDPKEFVSRPVAEARRQAATSDLLNAAQMRREPYQLALGGEASPTLQSIRSSEFGPNLTQTRERALGLVSAEAPSRPLAAAPDQLTLFEQDINKGFTPRGYLEKTGAVAPVEDLTSVQQQSLPQVIDQKMNAVESAEDQVTGRMKTQLQRNEDLDMSQVEVLEDIADQQRSWMMAQDEPINNVASQLPDGVPVDQTDLTPQLTSQQFADIARDEMMARRQALSESGLRGERLERALGREPSRTVSQALEAVSPADIDEAPLQERTLINIGPGAQIEKAASGTSIRGTSRIGAVAAPQEPTRQVSGPDYVMLEGRPVYTVNAPIEMAQDIPGVRKQSPPPVERIDEYALKSDLGGGIGIYGVEPAFAAGAVTKNIDLFQTPKGRTPLGLSPGAADPMISTTEAAGRQPSAVPAFTEKNNPFRAVSTEAIQKMAAAGTGRQSLAAQRELNRRTRNPEGLAVSEAMRRARIEGRDPQVFLDKLMRERGVSAAAGTSSPIR
jgi:hypothetical protein